MNTPRAGQCTEHGGLMWDNKRVCLTPDDVIRGGCVWGPLPSIVLLGESVPDPGFVFDPGPR